MALVFNLIHFYMESSLRGRRPETYLLEMQQMVLFTGKCRVSAAKRSALALTLSTGFLSLAYAQTNDDKSLTPVVVTASRIEQLQTEALPFTTVITSEMIRNKQPADVLSLLRNEAGIEITQNGGSGSLASVFMRGSNSNHVLVLLDGIPIRDTTTTGMAAPLQHILPDQIERIEIVRGNVSAIYGSGAVGGVIQIFTKQGSGKPSVFVSGEIGSRGTTKIGSGVSGKSGDTRYMLSATRFKTDGFSANNTALFPNENPDKDGDRNVSVAGTISHEWRKGNELGGSIYANDAKYSYDNGGDGPRNRIDEGKSKQKTFSLFSKNKITADWQSTLTASQTEIRRYDYFQGASFGNPNGERSNKSNTSMLQWTNEVALSSDWVMTGGWDLAREKANTRSGSTSEFSRTNYSAYAGLNGKSGAHSGQLNVRYDHVGDTGSDTTGYLGYGYDLSSSWKVIASASTAFLAPTMFQLHDAKYGTSDLKAEKARTYELGIQYANGLTLLRASLFDSRIRDLIDYSYSTEHYYNNGKVKNRGVELSASSRIADIDFRASLTLQNPENDLTGERLVRRAKTSATLGASKILGAWYLGGDVQYTGLRKDNSYLTYPSTPVNLGSYWVTNLNVRYQVNKEISIYSRLENAFDREYQTVYGYNQIPRGIFIGLNWKPSL